VSQITTTSSEITAAGDVNAAELYLANRAPGSRRTLGHALEVMAARLSGGRHTARTFPWGTLRSAHTSALRAQIERSPLAPATANKYLSALRGVLRESWRLGEIGRDDYERAVDLPRIGGSTLPRGRAVEPGELRAIFRALPPTPSGARDRALLALVYSGGLRRAEAVALDLGDYDPGTGAIRVLGKGRKERVIYARNGTREALDRWIEIRGDDPGPLFTPVHRAGRVEIRRMSTQAIYAALERMRERAGVAPFSPHDLRRSIIGDMLDCGVDLATVSAYVGHADVRTTSRYDRRGDRARERAAESIHVPIYG